VNIRDVRRHRASGTHPTCTDHGGDKQTEYCRTKSVRRADYAKYLLGAVQLIVGERPWSSSRQDVEAAGGARADSGIASCQLFGRRGQTRPSKYGCRSDRGVTLEKDLECTYGSTREQRDVAHAGGVRPALQKRRREGCLLPDRIIRR